MSSNQQFGNFLRSRRHRINPAVLGLASARRWRTPGLRREEVAERAGISCEWYVKLEQGRDVSASSATIAALANALLLDAQETAHLRRLADATGYRAFERETVPAIVSSIVEGLPEPAYATGARWDVLAWNPAAETVFGFSAMAERDRNILLWMFRTTASRELFGASWEHEARRMVGLFRTAHDRHSGDQAFQEIVDELCACSKEFAAWWSVHDIGQPSSGTKTLRATDDSETVYAYATFQSNDDAALKLTLYRRTP